MTAVPSSLEGMGPWGHQYGFRRVSQILWCRRVGTCRGTGPAGNSDPWDPLAGVKGGSRLEAET